MSGITVAIVTARRTCDTSWDRWRDHTRAFLRGDWTDPVLAGEFGALLAALNPHLWRHHIEIQLQALDLQTTIPDEVILVERHGESKTSIGELSDALSHRFPARLIQARASGPLPRGNADKNQAIEACRTEHMIMLDDCCLPGFAFVELAKEICDRGEILQPTHHKIYLPSGDGDRCVVAKSNEVASTIGHRVFGIWAMPVKHIRAVGGYDERLDGKHGLWDEELMQRMDDYVAKNRLTYARHSRTRVWEIEHDRPWADAGAHDSALLTRGDRG